MSVKTLKLIPPAPPLSLDSGLLECMNARPLIFAERLLFSPFIFPEKDRAGISTRLYNVGHSSTIVINVTERYSFEKFCTLRTALYRIPTSFFGGSSISFDTTELMGATAGILGTFGVLFDYTFASRHEKGVLFVTGITFSLEIVDTITKGSEDSPPKTISLECIFFILSYIVPLIIISLWYLGSVSRSKA